MDLIIVESPTKAKTLSKFLGSGYDVEATMGHIKDLPKSTLGVDVKHNFAPEFIDVPKREQTIRELKAKSAKARIIYIASDPDREGEAIASHVKELLTDHRSPITVHRISFHEITKEAVEDALKHPRDIDRNLVDAQTARRVLDRLVGYKLSPLLWKKVRRGLSAGRVQSVAVRLIVEKEKEILSFKAVEYWEIFCNVKTQQLKGKNEEFSVQLAKIGEKKAEVKDAKTAKEIVSDLEKSDYKVYNVTYREVIKRPYPPFTTSTLAQAGARIFGWSAKKTMSVAQALYEEGLITYHRTDSLNISAVALNAAREFINKEFGPSYLPEKVREYKTQSKVAQEAHEAIRPTDVWVRHEDKVNLGNKKFISDAKTLYKLIWNRFIATQMKDSIYDETRIDVIASRTKSNERKMNNYLLRATGQVMKFDGWRKVIPATYEEAPQLPKVEKDAALDLVKVNSEQKFTQPPARFNEASLIKTLEKLGIGRPSTYAPIISTIQVRQYVEKEEGKFFPTPVGMAVNDFLIGNFPDVFEYSFTAGMEDDLDKIANGEREWQEMMKKFYRPFEKKIKTVDKKSKRVEIETEKLGKNCPKCKKGELVIRIGRFGKFVSCSRFPDCDYKEKYLEKINMKCPTCKKGEIIVKTTRTGRKFYGCSRYPECDFASWQNPKLTGKKPEKSETDKTVLEKV